MGIRPDAVNTSLEIFTNPAPERDYTIRMTIPEFTCLCPKSGQPDFATLKLEYVPDQRCVELKSLKLYIWSFRDRGAFHEAVTNEILGARYLLPKIQLGRDQRTAIVFEGIVHQAGARPQAVHGLRQAVAALGASAHVDDPEICHAHAIVD